MSGSSSSPRGPGDATPTELMLSCQGLVRSLAWQVHQRVRGRIELDDLIAYGQVGLAEAASRFDPTQGSRFITYAHHRIRGAILDGLAKMDWFRPADFHAGRYNSLAGELLDGMAETGSSSLDDDAGWLTDVGARLSVVFLASGLSSDENSQPLATLPDGSAVSPQARAIVAELRTKVREMIQQLPEQGRKLIHMVYYEGLSIKASGDKLGISKSWASRLHDRMLRMIAASLMGAGIDAVPEA